MEFDPGVYVERYFFAVDGRVVEDIWKWWMVGWSESPGGCEVEVALGEAGRPG